MSDPLFEADDEANTPLTPEGREGLIPTYITTRAELNEAEQENIAEADLWAFARKRGDVVDADFLMSLHRRMLRCTRRSKSRPLERRRFAAAGGVKPGQW
jgi:fido (protein-threonine AMPylation protein)